MRCSNCTTELWGHPSVCPVCSAPTSMARAPRNQGTGSLRSNRPQPRSVTESPSSSFFNASDLVDPAILNEIGAAPAQPRQHTAHRLASEQHGKPAAPPAGEGGFLNAADLFDADIFDQSAPAEAQGPATGQINAADLFDPEVLGFPEHEEAPGGPALFNASELLDEDLIGDHLGQGWGGPALPAADDWINSPHAPQRAPTGAPMPPIAPPLFNLQPLAPEAPTQRPARSGARNPAGQAPIYTPDPMELDLDPGIERGWRIVPTATPQVGTPAGARPGRQRQPPPPKPRHTRRLTGTLGKAAALVLVLVIIGAAIQVGFVRCQQLNCWQSLLSGQSSALPTLTPIPGFTSYQDPQIGVMLEYPQGWQHVASHRDSDKSYLSDRFAVSSYAWIEIGTSPQYSGWTADQINAATINLLRSTPTVVSFQTWVPATSTTHIDGQDWSIEDAAFSLQDGTNLQLSTLALIYNGRGYVIFYQSHQEEFTHFSSQYFEPMLLSFRFLNH